MPSTTGNPEKLCLLLMSRTCPIVISRETVMGEETTPPSKRLTFSTSPACRSGDMFLWRTPRPPNCAIATAIADSVTVSIAADSTGAARGNRLWRCERTDTSPGRVLDIPGVSSTSSNVSSSRIIPLLYASPNSFARIARRTAAKCLPFKNML